MPVNFPNDPSCLRVTLAPTKENFEPSALTTLIAAARDDKSTKVRGQALFWLAQKASREAVAAISGAIENDPETDVKKKAVFALSQLPKDESVPKLIDVAKNNKNAAVRQQAMLGCCQNMYVPGLCRPNMAIPGTLQCVPQQPQKSSCVNDPFGANGFPSPIHGFEVVFRANKMRLPLSIALSVWATAAVSAAETPADAAEAARTALRRQEPISAHWDVDVVGVGRRFPDVNLTTWGAGIAEWVRTIPSVSRYGAGPRWIV